MVERFIAELNGIRIDISSTVYSYLLTFTSNTAKNAYYNEDEQYIRWNGQYCLRAEIEGAYYGWDERIQNVRWCP